MKKCIYQKRYREKYRCFGTKIKCKCTGTIRRECKIKECKYFYPTLIFRIFGKWWEK